MDPICEKKYNFLQKYVPFLANLIKLLANDNEKQGKLAQMQLLYDLLNKPDNSVKIETLEKCEEVLSRVFGNNEQIADEELVMPCPLIKAELPEESDDGLEQIEEKNWENLNGSIEQQFDKEPTSTFIDSPTKENHTEVISENETENTEPKRLDCDAESSKLATVRKEGDPENFQESMLSKLNADEEEQKEDTLVKKSDSKATKEVECSNKADVSNEVKETNNGESETKVDAETEAESNKKHIEEDEIKNSLKTIEKPNDLQVAKQNKSENYEDDSKSHSLISKTSFVEELEDKNNSSKVKNETELEMDKLEDTTILMKGNVECNESNLKACTTDSRKNEPESSSACIEYSQAIKVSENEEECLKTCDKENLLIAPSQKSCDPLNENDVSCTSKSDTSSFCERIDKNAMNTEENPPDETRNITSITDVKKNVIDDKKYDDINKGASSDRSRTDDQEQNKKEADKSDEIHNKSYNEEDITQEKKEAADVIRQSPTEMLGFKIVSAESLAATEKNNSNLKNDEKQADSSNDTANKTENDIVVDPLDPLTQTSDTLLETSKTTANGSSSPKHANKDEEDDDVLLVENRSSPICIDSDPEDEANMKGNCSLPIIPTKLPTPKQKQLLPKPNVRKSTTSVMESIRHIISKNQNITPKRKAPIQNKPKASREAAFVKKDAKALMETIDLLDSDSEDERSKINSKKPKTNTNTDDDVIIVSSTQPQRKLLTKKLNQTVPAPKQVSRHYSKLVNKSPSKPATAQSNFLNAVNLQPAKSNSSNPATFSARLSNKKVIIPNAFYGNPSYNRKSSLSSFSSMQSKAGSGKHDEFSSNEVAVAPPTRSVGVYSGVSIRHVQDKMLKEWLEGFLTNFASPLQIASHACFVLLQRVLKYRFFQRLKETRIYLNTAAKSCSAESVDVQMLLDLRNVFLENDYLTEAGRRFCRFATNDAFGKPVALTTDSRTGRVTCRTRVASKGDLPTDIAKTHNSVFIRNPKTITSDKSATSTTQSPLVAGAVSLNSKPFMSSTKTSPLSNTSTPSSFPKRRGKFRKLSDGLVVAEKDEDDNDYTPAHDEIEPEAEIVTERKRSLRTNRTKRKEAGFTYSEDHDDEEFEAIARKIENKKREEQRLAEERELEMEKEQLEQQRKANKKTVAKKTTAKRNGGQMDNQKGPTRKKLRLANTSIVGSEDNDLLTPTWIEADGDDGEVDSLLDFADDPESPDMRSNSVVETDNACENTFQNDESTEEASQDSTDTFDTHTDKTLKNIDRNLHLHNKTHDLCVHCQRKVPRIVHHYVNEHRSSEVFPSRLRNRDIRRLLTTSNVGFVHLYKGNQIQYAAHCIFCDKEAKFLLPYWFEHFTMHTGEYSFKCSGCHILKPTRSLLTNHIQSNTGCPKKGSAIRLVNFDTKVHQIEAHICSICNYIQLHRKNLLRHLRTQHGIDTISPNQIIKVVLLQISAPSRDQDAVRNDESQLELLQHSDDDDNDPTSFDDNSLMMQNNFTDNDDLSFMICGMLDVQTNLSSTG